MLLFQDHPQFQLVIASLTIRLRRPRQKCTSITMDNFFISKKALFRHQQKYYGVDLTPLFGSAHQGYFSQPVVDAFDPRLLVAPPMFHTIDFTQMKEEDFYEMDIPLKFTASMCTRVHRLACWFHVLFDGSTVQRWLTTAPGVPTMHRYQPTKSARTHVIHGSPQLHSLHGLLRVAGWRKLIDF
ncbi:PREDICTED: probable histone-arginine methyltransferase 1.3 isoform X2 [Brassica oleracea var. oleracea]|uniref:type I protein arginine methyltransferase n=2 Tax=Brassica oleracea TaxID=3712 RepID=A0A0D3B9R9_BRAOL|nr:PREDICTED: probable histone-arginine methyltransferase 1.3 isoform X2 [Brassica oleracea var. oleracea]VDC92610.1 unnamed protein product [Brassica oleracea]